MSLRPRHVLLVLAAALAPLAVYEATALARPWVLVGVGAAVLAGLVLAQTIDRPLTELVRSVGEFQRGNFSHRLRSDRTDDIGRLSATFDEMGAELERRNAELTRWNDELQARVEERTRELREAQELLLQSRKIGAVTSLGAGIAHEINNPLAGVLGLTQLLLARSQKGASASPELLAQVEKEALRIKRSSPRSSASPRPTRARASRRCRCP